MSVVKISKDLEDIIPDFMSYRKEDIENLDEAIKLKDFKTSQTIGHRLAGNGPGYGFDELGKIGVELEEVSKQENLDEVKRLADLYKSYLNGLTIEFE